MTIFLDIAKTIIVEEVNTIIKNSLDQDQSVMNLSLTTFGLGRNPELSNTKRTLLEVLKKEIESIHDKNDATALQTIKKCIENTLKQAKEESTKKGYNGGNTGFALLLMIQSIDTIYKTLEEQELLNIPHDNQPLNVFYFFAALYIAKKISEKNTTGVVKSLVSNPNISRVNELAHLKESLLWEKIKSCKKELNTLDKKHEEYDLNVRKCVLRSIEELLKSNQQFCYEKKSLFYKPGLGLLYELMSQASKIIKSAMNEQHELGSQLTK
ncbi:hypothetical protein [Legionella londiniensis]|uniref:Coiled-coil protein n=1 Tax=Legionella londiniensis TaxID=45068 RepID=A0A0W0VIX9_9GAMM|nr:hypothetical protein [Legionella londiniensis]KTD19837.1 coiled-coil protein [Legionella londiniensis]STX92250.1 coiled-coil protein [Legionella londiniensis]